MTLRGMILEGVQALLLKTLDDSTSVQMAQFESEAPDEDEQEDIVDVEILMPFGITSRAPAGSRAIGLRVGGDSSDMVTWGASHPDYRPKGLADGEVALFTKDGIRVHCKADGITYVGTDPQEFVALANLVLEELNAFKADLAAFKAAHDSHTHLTTATIGVGPAAGIISPTTTTFPEPHSPESVACTQLKAK